LSGPDLILLGDAQAVFGVLPFLHATDSAVKPFARRTFVRMRPLGKPSAEGDPKLAVTGAVGEIHDFLTRVLAA
jgi:hypothetical protein